MDLLKIGAALFAVAVVPSSALAQSAFEGKKSHVPGSRGGSYLSGIGSRHYGGHYTNTHTSDDYRDRAAGMSYN